MTTIKYFFLAMFSFVNIHKCRYLIVSCVDFRFFWRLVIYRLFHGLIMADLQQEPGGIKKIVDRVKDTLDDIVFLVNAHKVGVVYLFAHSDCGKYKSCGYQFDDAGVEQAFYHDQLQEAKTILSELLPEIEVRLVYARLAQMPRWVLAIETQLRKLRHIVAGWLTGEEVFADQSETLPQRRWVKFVTVQ